jgi:hypothetical protein
LCEECREPDEPKRDIEAELDKAGIEFMKMALRGEILDSHGNPVPAVSVIQHGGGKFTKQEYSFDEKGELICQTSYYSLSTS